MKRQKDNKKPVIEYIEKIADIRSDYVNYILINFPGNNATATVAGVYELLRDVPKCQRNSKGLYEKSRALSEFDFKPVDCFGRNKK